MAFDKDQPLSPPLSYTSGGEVAEALRLGEANISDSKEPSLGDYVVRAKVLRAFVESEPAGVLGHDLCDYRFRCTLMNTFGKKIKNFVPEDGEWMRWMPPPQQPAKEQQQQHLDADRPNIKLGRQLWEATQQLQQTEARPLFNCEQGAVEAVRSLRLMVERRMIQSSGSQLLNKDFRAIAMECTQEFLQEARLAQVVGLQRWVRDAVKQIAEDAAENFSVTFVS
jgi:hypothetical protein